MKQFAKSGAGALALALTGMMLAHAGAAMAVETMDPVLASAHEFELENGDAKTIANHKVAEPYRVCVSSKSDPVSVAVRYDDATRTLHAGECADVTAKHIVVAPGERMKRDEVLIGKFLHLRR